MSAQVSKEPYRQPGWLRHCAMPTNKQCNNRQSNNRQCNNRLCNNRKPMPMFNRYRVSFSFFAFLSSLTMAGCNGEPTTKQPTTTAQEATAEQGATTEQEATTPKPEPAPVSAPTKQWTANDLIAAVENAQANETITIPAGDYQISDLKITKDLTLKGTGQVTLSAPAPLAKGILNPLPTVSLTVENITSVSYYTSPSPRDQRGSRMPSSA